MIVASGTVTIANIDQGFADQLALNEEALDSFLMEVAIFVKDDAKDTAAFIDRTGNLRKSIGMRKSRFIRGGYIVKATGKNRGSGESGGKGFHAFLVEFGHVKVLWGRRTKGRVPPHPFIRPALDKGRVFASSKIIEMNGK